MVLFLVRDVIITGNFDLFCANPAFRKNRIVILFGHLRHYLLPATWVRDLWRE